MAKLTIAVASRVAGVARSTLYRAIQTGRLSADPYGRLDTAELLRAGYTLQRSAQQPKGGALHDAPPRTTDAQQPSAPAETQAFHVMQQERDMLRLERDMLRQQLEAAQMREHAALEREREAAKSAKPPANVKRSCCVWWSRRNSATIACWTCHAVRHRAGLSQARAVPHSRGQSQALIRSRVPQYP
jgi:hypothetical protein